MASTRAAEIVVVVNPVATTITKQQLAELYLGRAAGWTPIDQATGSGIYADFYSKATGRSVAQIREIWSRILFTGRGVPPKELSDSAAVKRAVAANPKAIGYIEKSAVDDTVKVALALD
jgi:ABC-type phosphate transport system substrate-binding protein